MSYINRCTILRYNSTIILVILNYWLYLLVFFLFFFNIIFSKCWVKYVPGEYYIIVVKAFIKLVFGYLCLGFYILKGFSNEKQRRREIVLHIIPNKDKTILNYRIIQ